MPPNDFMQLLMLLSYGDFVPHFFPPRGISSTYIFVSALQEDGPELPISVSGT